MDVTMNTEGEGKSPDLPGITDADMGGSKEVIGPLDPRNKYPKTNGVSYRDSLLRFGKSNEGTSAEGQEHWKDAGNEMIDDLEDEVAHEGKEEDPTNSVILTTKEERLEWSKPWKGSLIIKLMRRRGLNLVGKGIMLENGLIGPLPMLIGALSSQKLS
ncbi:uncharacterized protein G2W53_014340 [Senna tora]|uniref:Uncharacterized protein n=1 Tax=Senna tora TaxID=362788 RepID=A0A835C7V2_9FABA|nr:uncharacterized protein G2W53_014340 [Senna tora]